MTSFPGPAITLLVWSINAVSDGLRDAFDPWVQL
jgi:ABC-type dipeptide/oligopeptide/nickel transport system permease subunit